MARSSKSTASRTAGSSAYVALLRGINVGAANRLPMPMLTAMFSDAGCTSVRAYIQSGNIVFSAPSGVAKRIARLISQRIADDFGIRAPVVIRTPDALRQAVAGNPFLKSGAAVESLHVAFLDDLPERDRVAALDPARSPGDTFKVHGREVYLHLPNGVARSKLTNAYFDSTLATISTVRNWRTVLKLLEMTQATS